MTEEKKADIKTIKSSRSSDEINRIIERALSDLKAESSESILVQKAGTSIRVTGSDKDKPESSFHIEISVHHFDDHSDIDVAAIGDRDSFDESGQAEASSRLDFDESERIRNILVESISEERKNDINERLKYLKSVVRREMAAQLREARNNDDKETYEAAMNRQKKLESEIEALEKELKSLEATGEVEPSGNRSIFSLNKRYSNYAESELASKTGISLSRIKEINAGAEPLLSELIMIATAFDVSPDRLVGNEWFEQQYDMYYDQTGSTFFYAVNEKDVKLLTFVISFGLVRMEDEFYYKTWRGLHQGHTVEEELLAGARSLLLANEMPSVADHISTEKSYYSVSKLDAAVCSRETLMKYLFKGGSASPCSYFVNFFNGLDNEDDKKDLLVVLKANLESFTGKERYEKRHNIKGVDYIIYDYTDENGVKRLSNAWYRRELDGLEISGESEALKSEIIEMQERLFTECTN